MQGAPLVAVSFVQLPVRHVVRGAAMSPKGSGSSSSGKVVQQNIRWRQGPPEKQHLLASAARRHENLHGTHTEIYVLQRQARRLL